MGTEHSILPAVRANRPGGHLGAVDTPHGVSLSCEELFYSGVHLHGAPAPVLGLVSELIDLVERRMIRPRKVVDLTLPLGEASEGYCALHERSALKDLLLPA